MSQLLVDVRLQGAPCPRADQTIRLSPAWQADANRPTQNIQAGRTGNQRACLRASPDRQYLADGYRRYWFDDIGQVMESILVG